MRNDSAPAIQAAVQTNIEPIPPKNTATKRKSVVGPSGEEAVEVEQSQKEARPMST